VTISGVVADEVLVNRLIVERNGSDYVVRWTLHADAADVTDTILVWCESRYSRHSCEVLVMHYFLCCIVLPVNTQLLSCLQLLCFLSFVCY